MGLMSGGSRPGSASGSRPSSASSGGGSRPGSANALGQLGVTKTMAMTLADKARNRKTIALQQAGITLPARPKTAPAEIEAFYGDPENHFHNKRMSFGFVEAARPMTPSVTKHLQQTKEYEKKQAKIDRMKSHNRMTTMKRQTMMKRTETMDPGEGGTSSAEFTHGEPAIGIPPTAHRPPPAAHRPPPTAHRPPPTAHLLIRHPPPRTALKTSKS